MLHVLLESRAPRPRRIGSTAASALLHAALIAAAVAVTIPGAVDARAREGPLAPTIFVSPPRARVERRPSHADDGLRAPAGPLQRTIDVPDVIPDALPPVDVGPVLPADELAIGGRGVRTDSPIGADASPSSTGPGAILDERMVDRAPRLLGRAIEPHYPAMLRDAGIQGRVVVQFVVDTLGRAEQSELQVLESPHTQLTEAVRAVLGRYRFSVGESAGRKVRTRVQMPFDFTLTK